MGQDDFLYFQVSLDVFFNNFISSKLPARCSKPFVNSVASRRGAKGRANAMSTKHKVLVCPYYLESSASIRLNFVV